MHDYARIGATARLTESTSGTDGLLIRALRHMEEPARSMPAAALSAYAHAQDRFTWPASGFQIHLVKPIDPPALIVSVATLAPRRSVPTSPSPS